MKKIFILLVMFFGAQSIYSQSPNKLALQKFLNQNWSVNPSYGSLLYYGDMRKYDFYPVREERTWGYGINISKAVSPNFSINGQLIKGNLAGAKSFYKFEGDIFDYSINGVFNLTRLVRNFIFNNSSKQSSKLGISGYIGIGYVDFRSKLYIKQENVFVSSQGYSNYGTTKTKKTTELVVPYGMMINYRIANNLLINLDISLRNVNTDKLDAKKVPNSSRDKYEYIAIGFIYKFNLINSQTPQL